MEMKGERDQIIYFTYRKDMFVVKFLHDFCLTLKIRLNIIIFYI